MENLNSILQQIQNTRTKALSDLQLLIEEANFKKKLQQNIQSHPSAWALASAAAGFFLSKLLFRKKKKTKNFNYQPNFKTPSNFSFLSTTISFLLVELFKFLSPLTKDLLVGFLQKKLATITKEKSTTKL